MIVCQISPKGGGFHLGRRRSRYRFRSPCAAGLDLDGLTSSGVAEAAHGGGLEARRISERPWLTPLVRR